VIRLSNNYTVYIHISPSNKRYIGITSIKPFKRWNNGKGYKNNEHFFRAINKYGWDNFQHIIIAKGLDEETAQWLEIELIREWDSTNPNKGYNKTLGGESCNGWTPSEETRQRMSENHADVSGENNPFFRKSHTEEFKNSLSEQRMGEGNPMYGVRYSEEKRKAIGDRQRGEKSCWFGVTGENHPRFGVKATDETRKLISENHADISGANNPRAEKIGLIDIDTNTILYFDTNKQCNDYLIDLLKLNSKRISIYNYKDKKIYKKRYLFVSLNENYEIKNKDFVNNYIIIDKLRIVA
jgi:group I intron endonuclease